jgi:uncharacterized protein involved in type VI secretion and phage assembly
MRVAVNGQFADPQPLNTQFTVTLPHYDGVNVSEMLSQVAIELTTSLGVVQTVHGVVSRCATGGN